jgi:hypothetical protein
LQDPSALKSVGNGFLIKNGKNELLELKMKSIGSKNAGCNGLRIKETLPIFSICASSCDGLIAESNRKKGKNTPMYCGVSKNLVCINECVQESKKIYIVKKFPDLDHSSRSTTPRVFVTAIYRRGTRGHIITATEILKYLVA